MRRRKLLGVLTFSAALGLSNSAPSNGQEPVSGAVLTSDIPAQPLGSALNGLAAQTGIRLVYVSEAVRDRKSHAVASGSTAIEALTAMLKGTGLRFQTLTPGSVRILRRESAPIPDNGNSEVEVVVSANRWLENVNSVPMSVQVLTGATLNQLNVATFDDLVGYLPAVTAHGVGPSQENIYIRGLGTGEYGNQAAGSNGSFPNVAVYLDEQPAQLPGRNLDVYAADLNRIEVLEGPQGTLFGAGAQAGALRYITNKPQLNNTESEVKAGYATTAHGNPSTSVEVVLNLPLVSDRLAARAVIYDEQRGGYIDNIPATFARSDSDRSIRYANYPTGCDFLGPLTCKVPPNSVTINNSALVSDNINSVTYEGIRAELLYQPTDDWSALLEQSYQSMKANGEFTQTTTDSLGNAQPDLTVQEFNASYDNDRFENTALTLEGRLRNLDILYAGSYLVRKVDQVQDYTNYARGGIYVDYYQCINPGATAATAQCFSPSATWHVRERNTHESHELRIKTADSGRVRAVGGLFYENLRIHDNGDWFYMSALPYFNPIAPPTGYYTLNGNVIAGIAPPEATFVPRVVTSNDPGVRPGGDAFFNDITRGYDQKAAYTSVDFELIPGLLTATAGTRYFRITGAESGSLVGSFGCSRLPSNFLPGPLPDPCINHSNITDLDALGLKQTYSGLRSRASLSWKLTAEALLYYTWSQGFRSGGFNRGFSIPAYSPLSPGPFAWQAEANQHLGYTPRLTFAPDNLTSNEIGWKASWWDRRIAWNAAIYQEDWEHAQIGAFDPQVVGDSVINGGTYRVRGFETSVSARIVSSLMIESSLAWNHSELVKEAMFYWADGTPIDFNILQTYTGQRLVNPAGTRGSPLAGAPPFRASFKARYQIAFVDYNAFIQVGALHESHSIATTDSQGLTLQGTFVDYNLPAFTTYTGSVGVEHDNWVLRLTADNLTDTRAQLYTNYDQNYKSTTVNRPRTIGLQFFCRYSSEGH